MGELAEALRRANEGGREDRPERSQGSNAETGGRTLSLDEVLGRGRDTAPQPLGSDSNASEDERDAAPNVGKKMTGDAPRRIVIQPVSREAEIAHRAQRIAVLDESDAAAAAARRIAQKVRRHAAQRGLRSIVVTSSLRGEGKTTTACNLAVALTRLDRSESVVLVDLDLRRPSIARSLGLRPEKTINDVLEGRATLDEAIILTDVPGLHVLATDRGIQAPESLLSSHKLRDLVELLERRFTQVVIDTPPALVVSDASSAIEAADAFIFVASAGQTPTKSVSGALEHLPREKMLGCVLNFAREGRSLPTEYYYGDKLTDADLRSEQTTTGEGAR